MGSIGFHGSPCPHGPGLLGGFSSQAAGGKESETWRSVEIRSWQWLVTQLSVSQLEEAGVSAATPGKWIDNVDVAMECL